MEDVLILNIKEVSTAGGREVPGVKSEERMRNVWRGKWGGSHDDAAGILLSIVGSLGCQLWIREWIAREGGGNAKTHLFRRLVKHLAPCTKCI